MKSPIFEDLVTGVSGRVIKCGKVARLGRIFLKVLIPSFSIQLSVFKRREGSDARLTDYLTSFTIKSLLQPYIYILHLIFNCITKGFFLFKGTSDKSKIGQKILQIVK